MTVCVTVHRPVQICPCRGQYPFVTRVQNVVGIVREKSAWDL